MKFISLEIVCVHETAFALFIDQFSRTQHVRLFAKNQDFKGRPHKHERLHATIKILISLLVTIIHLLRIRQEEKFRTFVLEATTLALGGQHVIPGRSYFVSIITSDSHEKCDAFKVNIS